MLKVLVVDDDELFADSVRTRLAEALPAMRVSCSSGDALQSALAVLHDRRTAARDGQAVTESCTFDEVDVLVIDFDLAKLPTTSLASGEMLAYLARCYSSCGVIVGLNQFGDNTFDLTLAKGAMSYADLNIGALQVTRPSLWSTVPRDGGLAAWAWSPIPAALDALQRRTDWIQPRLDEPMNDSLGELFSLVMPRGLLTELGHAGEMTWRLWVQSRALQRKDKVPTDADQARVAAARVAHWLERVVLPTQDILVDAPHLVSRYPGLLANAADSDDWDATCDRGLSARMNYAVLEPCLLPNWQQWLSRPAWLWPNVRELAVAQTWEALPEQMADVVFCEDVSRFEPPSAATAFDCGLRTAFARRYVRRLDGVDYQPSVRLLSGHV
jgi:hypothetical protein